MTLQEAWQAFLNEVDDDAGDVNAITLARLVVRISEDVTKNHRGEDCYTSHMCDVADAIGDF